MNMKYAVLTYNEIIFESKDKDEVAIIYRSLIERYKENLRFIEFRVCDER